MFVNILSLWIKNDFSDTFPLTKSTCSFFLIIIPAIAERFKQIFDPAGNGSYLALQSEFFEKIRN